MNELADGTSSQTTQRATIGAALVLALLTVGATALNSLPLRVLVLLFGLALLAVLTVLVNALVGSRARRRATRERIVKLRRLLNEWPPRSVSELSPYAVGVRPPAAAITQGALFPEYVRRDVDAAVGAALRSAPIVLLVGPACAGKSRTAFEALANCTRTAEAVVLLPDDKQALADVLAAPGCVIEPNKRYVLWLDDLDRFLEKLGPRELDRFIYAADPDHNGAEEVPGVTVVATLRDDVFLKILAEGGDTAHVLRGLIARAEWIVVPATLTPAERERLAVAYPDAPPVESFLEIFGETMVQLGHAIYRAPVPPQVRRRQRPSLSPVMAGVLALALAVGAFVAGQRWGWIEPPALEERFATLAAHDDPCGGVGVSPTSVAAVHGDVVQVVHRGDGCPESDIVKLFPREGNTLAGRPAAAFQPAVEHRAKFQCLGPDRADPCHPDLFGGKRVIVGAWEDGVNQKRLPVAIYRGNGRKYEIVALNLTAPEAARESASQSAFRAQFAQPSALSVTDRRWGRKWSLRGPPATVTVMLPPRSNHGAILVAGYAVGRRVNAPQIVARGFELRLRNGRIATHAICDGTPGSGLRFPAGEDLTQTLRRHWIRATAARRISCSAS
jgi:hypothetical protein